MGFTNIQQNYVVHRLDSNKHNPGNTSEWCEDVVLTQTQIRD